MTRSLALRVWQGFSTFDIFGENLVLVLHMAAKILPFMLTFIVLAIGFGAAFTGLIGPDSSGGNLVMQPWTFSWWALNGEVEAAMKVDPAVLMGPLVVASGVHLAPGRDRAEHGTSVRSVYIHCPAAPFPPLFGPPYNVRMLCVGAYIRRTA